MKALLLISLLSIFAFTSCSSTNGMFHHQPGNAGIEAGNAAMDAGNAATPPMHFAPSF